MAVNTKAIKSRMKSIGNTKKITKALEMVSAAKMRRAIEAALRTRTYAHMAKELLEQLSKLEQQNIYPERSRRIPLLQVRPVKKVLILYVTSNRGLCGSFNSNLLKKTALYLLEKEKLVKQGLPEIDAEAKPQEVMFEVMGIGKKSAAFAKKTGLNLSAVYDTIGEKPSFNELLPVARNVVKDFTDGNYDKVFVAYTEYKSSLTQEPTMRQILPVTKRGIDEMIGSVDQMERNVVMDEISLDDYLFEPGRDEVLSTILPRLVEIQFFQAVLESSASEHSARMVAMKNAKEAANEMLEDLQLSFNKARQAAITQEISEIVGGAAALE